MSTIIFDPNAASNSESGLFGLPFDTEQSQIIIIPVAWELTTSYNRGTVNGPEAILSASLQVDLHHHDYPDLWKHGIWMDKFPDELKKLHQKMIPLSEIIIEAVENGEINENPKKFESIYLEIEKATEQKNVWLKQRIAYWKSQGKIVGLLGGDHSIPLAYHQFFAEQNTKYGILHFDAHFDLRYAFEGFRYSHASIFNNVLKFSNVERLVQVGIRDYCDQEIEYVMQEKERIAVFFDRDYRKRLYEGENWKRITDEIISRLPENVYVSVDIDALDPKLCPNTGTPVPGGLEYEEMMYVLNQLKKSKKNIIGFDLCEVSPGDNEIEWDGNVGARVLFHLCGISIND